MLACFRLLLISFADGSWRKLSVVFLNTLVSIIGDDRTSFERNISPFHKIQTRWQTLTKAGTRTIWMNAI